MKLARYWARGEGEGSGPRGRIRRNARGWSDESMEAAREAARSLAARVAQKLASGDTVKGQYLYGDRPLPEPVLREFGAGGEPSAVITRNVYGSTVLNTSDLMFVDIDREDKAGPAAAGGGLLRSLFGKPAPAPAVTGVLAEIQRTTERNGLSARVYKTAAGYRAIITNHRFKAGDARTESLLRDYGSDPLYIRLCKLQDSFRARLTPKPWRCGLRPPAVSFPFEDPKDEAAFREWEARYRSACAAYATCNYLQSFGPGQVESGFQELIDLHDQETRVGTGLPLA